MAPEAVKEEKTLAQLGSAYGIHPNQIGRWRKKLLEHLPVLFSNNGSGKEKERKEFEAELYRQIGQLKLELEWLKKNLRLSVKQMRTLVEPGHPEIPIYRQCELLGLSRSGYYYQKRGERSLNQHLMNLIGEQYTKTPFYGVEKMTQWLRRQGFQVNPIKSEASYAPDGA